MIAHRINSMHLVIQCRYYSTRLPGKALLPFANTNLIGFLIKRLRDSKETAHLPLIVITSDSPEDDRIVFEAKTLGIPCFRGSLNNVYLRYFDYLKSLDCPPQYFTRVTADNPFTCPKIIQECHHKALEDNLDYLQSQNHPIGIGSDIFKTTSFLSLNPHNLSQPEQEHINLTFLNNPDSNRISFWQCPWEYGLSSSVTIDTEMQYQEALSYLPKSSSKPWLESFKK
jgi:spore coat polysaccharide biosynthesis protein SpsF